jgi:hypothetical protein
VGSWGSLSDNGNGSFGAGDDGMVPSLSRAATPTWRLNLILRHLRNCGSDETLGHFEGE